MLEDPRPGNRTFLRDVPDDEERRPASLGVARKLRSALAHLRHRPRRRLQHVRPQRLDRIDDGNPGFACIERCGDFLELNLCQQVDSARGERKAPCAHGDLIGRLFSADVERLADASQRRERLQQQCGFADSGIAADQHHLPCDQPATEHAVEFAKTGRRALDLLRFDRRQRDRDCVAREAPPAPVGNRLGQRPGGAARRTGAEPLQRACATIGADESGLGFGHYATSRIGTRAARPARS